MLVPILVGAAAVVCHVWVRRFVGRRLRFTPVVLKPGVGMAATVVTGVGAAFACGVVFSLLPFVGAGSALAIGAGAGSGVWFGRKRARSQRLIEG